MNSYFLYFQKVTYAPHRFEAFELIQTLAQLGSTE